MRDFLHYITRPSGFGRTPWSGAIIMHVAFLGMIVQGFIWHSTAAKFVFYFGVIVYALVWLFTWLNYRTDRKEIEKPNHHMDEVYHEGKPLPTRRDGGPILDIVTWYVAVHECSREVATRACKYESAKHEYRTYLANKKFNRFK